MKSRKREGAIVDESPIALVLTGNNGPLKCVDGCQVHESLWFIRKQEIFS